MKKPEIPHNEPQRVASLCALNVLDTPAEDRFDRLTRIAQQHFGVSIALVSLVDEDRQWFKSRQGLDAPETPRDISFCGHAILSEDTFYIPNALEDSRFVDNPLVTGPPNIRFYAGAPLHAPDGERVGTLCIIDDKPREFSEEELTVLRDLADGVEAELERTHLLENSQSLQKSEARLQHLIKATHGVIYACKAFGDFGATFISSNSENILGYRPQDFIENSSFWLEHVHPDDRDTMLKDLEKLFVLGDYAHEYRFLHRDGNYRWMHDKLHLIRDGSGNPLEIVGLWTDITESKEAEEKTKQLAMVAERTDNAVIITDAEGSIEWVNQGFERITGYTQAEVVGKKPGTLLQGRDTDSATIGFMSEKIRNGESFSTEVLNYHKDGTPYWLAISVQPIHNDNNQLVNFIAIESDITKNKKFENEIQSRENRLRAVIDTVVDGIVSIDAKGIIHAFNPAAESIFGYKAKEVIGCNVNILMPGPYADEHDGYLHHYLSTGEKKVIGIGREVTGKRKNGSTFPMELAVSEMQINGDRMFTGIVRDISVRKRDESAIEARENRIRAIVDTVVDGIIVIDDRGCIETFNPAAEKLFGYHNIEVQGQNVNMLMPDPYTKEHDGYLHHYLSTGEKKSSALAEK